MTNILIYPYSHTDAVRRGLKDLERYIQSFSLNVKCACEIEKAVRRADGIRGITADIIKLLADKYGIDRVNYVLANSINHIGSDKYISQENREWAKSIPVVPDFVAHKDRTRRFAASLHPEQLNMLAELTRERYGV